MRRRPGQRSVTMVAVAAALTLVAACGSDDPPRGRPLVEPPMPQPVNAAEVAADPSLVPAVQTITAFGYRLYQQTATPGTNTVLSPLSIVTALGMARAGAAGETAAELDRVLGLPAEGPHAALNTLIRALVSTHGSAEKPAPVVRIANGLFVQDGFTLKEPFTHILGQRYLAQARGVDFGGPDATRAIDAWVREQTGDRIQKLFDGLDPATKLVLANAVYLKADWRFPFGETPTSDAPFTRADGGRVPVPMMAQTAQLRYAAGDGWQAVELPYVGDDLAMWVLVPSGSGAPDPLLAPPVLAAVAAGLRPTAVSIALPRWDFGANFDLVEQLSKLGLRTTFGPGGDFSGIADGLALSQAMHRANITVNEQGTEAAAATGTAFATAGHIPGVSVRADHPFAFAIVHSPTATPLFIGRVADPTIKNR